MNKVTLNHLSKYLSKKEIKGIIRLSEQTQSFEDKWLHHLNYFLNETTDMALKMLIEDDHIDPKKLNFDEFFLNFSFSAQREALENTHNDIKITEQDTKRMSKIPKGLIPRNLKDLMTMWDYYRKKNTIPPREKAISTRVKKAYLNKVRSVWEKYSKEFREGGVVQKEEIVLKVKKEAQTQYSRSKMIVETETTRYFNQVRKVIYDASPDVTHYLFVAIRDFATTEWCKTRTGLVYKKDDKRFEREIPPPIHYNCRSDLLPLSPLNPNHRKLIEDKSKWRENNRCAPLLKEWNRV